MSFIHKLKTYFIYNKIFFFLSLFLSLINHFFFLLSGFIVLDNLLFFSKSFRYVLFGLVGFYLLLIIIRIMKKGLLKNDFVEIIADLDNKLKTDDLFTNAYFLAEEKENPFSADLIRKANGFENKITTQYIDKKDIKRKSVVTSIFLALYVVYVLLAPKNFLLTSSRLLLPWTDYSKNFFFLDYKIKPGNKNVVFGANEKIVLESSDKIKEAILYYKGSQTQFEKEHLIFKTNVNKKYVYSTRIKDIQENISYYVRIKGQAHGAIFDSKTYTLKSIHAPLIQNINIVYKLPDYVGGGEITQKENGYIEGLKGSQVFIDATANKRIQKAYCVLDGKKYKAQTKKKEVLYSFLLKKKGKYFIQLQDKNGLTNAFPVHYTIDILEDLKPEVKITVPGKDIELNNDMVVPIKIQGKDDYRIQSLKFYFYIKRTEIKTTNVRNLPIEKNKEIEYAFEFNLEDFNMVPGDTLFYFAEINDGYPDQSHVVRTPAFRIKFPSLLDMYKSVDQEEDKHIETLSDIVEKQKEYEKKIQELTDKLSKKEKLSFVEKQQLENLLKKEKKLLKNTKKLAQDVEKTIKKIEKNKMNSQEVVKKMREIQQLLNEVATKEMKENIEKLQKNLENMNLSEKDRKQLSQKLDQKKLIKKLDNTLKMLKELKKNRKLNNIAKKMENILDKQRDINQKTAEQNKANPNKEELQKTEKKQKENQNAIDDLKKSLEEFNKEYNKSQDEINKDFEKSIKTMQSNQIKKQMGNVQKSLQNQKMSKAQQQEMKLMNDLMSLQNQVSKNIKKKQQQSMEKIFSVLDNAIWNLMGISLEQRRVTEKLQVEMSHKKDLAQNFVFEKDNLLENYKRFSFPDLGEKEIYLKRNLMFNKRNLQSLLEKMIMLPKEFYEQFDKIGNQMDADRGNLEEHNIYFSTHYSKMVYDSLNVLILEIMNIKENIKDQAQSSSQQGMSEGMEQIGKGQKQVNQSTEQLMGQIGEKGTTPQQQEYMKELAYQQDLIKQSFDDLMSGNKGENGKKFLGDKDKLSKDMKEISEKLKQGQIDKGLVNKQKKVLKKLLDSEKSMKVKEKSKERKSKTAEQIYSPQSPSTEKKELLKKKYYDYKTIERFPEEYRKVIEEYLKQVYK